MSLNSNIVFDKEYLQEYLSHLGLKVSERNMEIAKWALQAPLPSGWTEGTTSEGELYYWRKQADGQKEVRWEHPVDDMIKKWINETNTAESGVQVQFPSAVIAQPKEEQEFQMNEVKSDQSPIELELRALSLERQKEEIYYRVMGKKKQIQMETWNELSRKSELEQSSDEYRDQLLNEMEVEIQKAKQGMNLELYRMQILIQQLQLGDKGSNDLQSIENLQHLIAEKDQQIRETRNANDLLRARGSSQFKIDKDKLLKEVFQRLFDVVYEMPFQTAQVADKFMSVAQNEQSSYNICNQTTCDFIIQ